FTVGDVGEPVRALIESTRQATLIGIAAVVPNEPLQRIGQVVESFAASRGYGVVREYGGHGIGATFHAAPHINHCVDRADHSVATPGISFTVEPMLTCGRSQFACADDGWTEQLRDWMPSAQFEHTVLVTEHCAEILTVNADGVSAVGTLASIEPELVAR